MKAGIQKRGNAKYRVQVRRNGVYQSKTFATYREAAVWQRIVEGKATGGELVDLREAKGTTLREACTWMLDGNHMGAGANAYNSRCKLRFWMRSKFATWSIMAIHDWDLIEWRREILDEDAAEHGEAAGPKAECSPQTVIHRLNTLSKLVQTWARAHKVVIENPVKRGVRRALARPGRSARSAPERVEADWRHPGQHLRDRVRRAVKRGHALMARVIWR